MRSPTDRLKLRHRPLRVLPRKVGPFLLAGSALLGVLTGTSAARAQAAGYDTSLRSIGPATINQANFDVRARSPILSIAASTMENRPSMVPAVYDPSVGRFVSATTPSRGAIAVSSSGMISVIVSQQSGAFVTGSLTSSTPLHSEGVPSPSATVTTTLITATPTGNGR
ncbi:MAG: hypothetical protein ACKVOL_03410 [Novosphingobium sp.]